VDDATSLPAYRARIARVEEQLAELQAEVADLKRLFSRSASESNFESDNGLLSGEAATVRPDEENADPVEPAAHSEVVLTVLARAAPYRGAHLARGGQPEFPTVADAKTRIGPIVFVVTSPELADWAHAQPEPLREHVASLIEGVQEQLSEDAAGSLVDAVWEPVTAPWHVTDFGGFESLSGLPAALDNWSHEEIGNWVSGLGRLAGLPGGVANGVGVVIRYTVPLPVDQGLEAFSRGIQAAGIAAFAMAGGHVLASAVLKSLVRDELTNFVAENLRNVICPREGGPELAPDTPDDPEARVMHELGTEESKSPKPADPASVAGPDFDLKAILPPYSVRTLDAASGHLDSIEPDIEISPSSLSYDDKDSPKTPGIEI
jgi:hypothetical protein